MITPEETVIVVCRYPESSGVYDGESLLFLYTDGACRERHRLASALNVWNPLRTLLLIAWVRVGLCTPSIHWHSFRMVISKLLRMYWTYQRGRPIIIQSGTKEGI